MRRMTREDEPQYWLSGLGSLESLAPSEEDIAGGRAYGGDEVHADLAEMSAELSAADADYASGHTVSGEELRQRYGLS